MTALNQAIIKAYLRQGGLPTPDEPEPAEAACAKVAPQEDVPTATPETVRPSEQKGIARPARPLSVPLAELQLTSTSLPSKIAEAIESPVSQDDSADRARSTPFQADMPSCLDTPPGPSGQTFEPMLRVDAISWPRPSRRLRHVAGEQIERLAETVRKAATSGKKLVGVAGFSHGEGCTTVLLAVAIRLVELGNKTLLLDGDITKPKLAEQLALANDMGWRDVALGSIPLEDAVTQSDSECLALLPYSGLLTPSDGHDPSEQAIKALVERLRGHYDLILVDLGGALTCGGRGGALAEKLAEQIDSVLTVQNVQATSPSHLAMLRQHLCRLGVEETGVIENFVDEGTA